MVRGVEVCGRSEVCVWGGVVWEGWWEHVCASIYSVQVFAYVHMCVIHCVTALEVLPQLAYNSVHGGHLQHGLAP